MKDCPSRRAFIAAPDGDGYVSASDVEEDLALAANITIDSEENKVHTIDSHAASTGYPSLLVQCVLTSQVGCEEETKIQRNNLFHMFLVVQDRCVLTIIDTGSYNNLVSSDLVSKLGLTTRAFPHPYHVQWFNSSGKANVTRSARIHFSVGSYQDYADFDVVPMQTYLLLLGRPWEYDKDVAHHGRTNTYTFMHKGKNITLLPLSPIDIMNHFIALAKNAKDKPANIEPSDVKPGGIKLKEGVFLATTSATAELCDNHDAPCYTMFCQDVSIFNDTMSCAHSAVTNLLQEIVVGMESRTTLIQDGEDDEDIIILDAHTPWPSPSYKSSPTWSPRSVRIQPTPLHSFSDISLIRHRNEVFFDALERGQRRHRFGSGPSSRTFVAHAV